MALTDNLVEYWNLDEASGTRVGSHAGLDLADNATVTAQATGGPDGGQCAQFTAANSEYLSRASEAAFLVNGVSFTFSAWVYFDTTGDFYRILLAKRDLSNYSYQVHYAKSSEGGGGGTHFKMEYGSGGYGTIKNVVSVEVPSNSTWYFVIAQFDVSSGVLSLFINDGSANASASVGASVPTDASDPFHIGNDNAGSYMDGRMAMVGFWKRILTSGERTQLYNSGAGLTYAGLSAGGSTTRGAPFGSRGTAFNGGRTFMGILR